MSNLQRDLLKKKLEDRENALRKMGIFQEDVEEDDEEQETDSIGDLGMPPPSRPVRRLDQQKIASLLPSASKGYEAPMDAFKRSSTTNSRYKPTSWEEYFEENFTVTVELEPDQNEKSDTPAKHKKVEFNVYFSAPSNPETMPVFAFHHGAGSSALSFAVSAKAIKEVFASDGASTSLASSMAGTGIGSLSAVAPKLPTAANQAAQNIPGMIPLPGSGMPATVYPGTTNAVSQAENSSNSYINENPESLSNKNLDTPGVLAFDARYHGKTKVYNKVGENEYEEEPPEEMDMYIDTLSRDFINVINSVYERKRWGSDSKVNPPLILIGHSLGGSVVTSTALISKKNSNEPITSLLKPTLVTSVTGVVALDVVEGTAVESLNAMSMILDSRPSSFESIEKAIEWHARTKAIRNLESAKVSVPSIVKLHDNSKSTDTSSKSDGRYEWITDLRKTEPFWNNWFVGLSEKFLQVPAARLLVLAGTDRLDKELMIGQMQGKYQLVVFQDAGHFVQEDVPQKLAHLLHDFWERNNKTNTIVPVFGSFRKN